MTLDEITSSMLAEAIDIYLRIAYAEGQPTEAIRELARVDRRAPLAAALARDGVETRPVPGHPGVVGKYLWRLGNARYPHMKLGIERCSRGDDFVFCVDTHDRDLPLGSGAFDDPDYIELIRHNQLLKHRIETRFHLAGIPTMRGHLADYLRERCAITGRRPTTVLIVDDDEAILELEQALIEEAGFRVLAASSALDALALLHREGPVDVCLLDIMMPSLDGRTAAAQLRRHSDRRLPIVYVTALPRDRARDDLADDYVGKPFDPDFLLDVIRKHVE
jgi:CheY-like chemotaxis protein